MIRAKNVAAHSGRPSTASIVFLILAMTSITACKRVPADESGGRVMPTEPPPKVSANAIDNTCVGKNLADKAALGDAREADLGCPKALDRKKYTTRHWPAAITLAYDEDPVVDAKFTTSARALLPMGDPAMGPACCYVTTRAGAKK